MFRSKSRSGYIDFGRKRHSSVFSRSISGSKLCRGDALASQVNKDTLISVERNNNPSKIVNLSENRVFKTSARQQQMMDDLEEELKRVKEKLGAAERERDQALTASNEVLAEVKALKDLSSNSKKELEIKDKDIEFLQTQLENAKQFELKLAEREASLDKMNHELDHVKASEVRTMGFWSESNRRIQELQAEVERVKLSESKMFESVVSQTKLLEQTKIELEESKLEIVSLHEQMEKLQISPKQSNVNSVHINSSSMNDHEFEKMKSGFQLAKEGEKLASSNAKNLLDELTLLRNELKLATEGEEKSRKAMDDLALALKEVAMEASQAKEKLEFAELEVEHLKQETEQLKEMIRSSEDKYQKLLDGAYREMELQKNRGDRLSLEAEELLLAWNGKEMGFVSCIKTAEEDRDHVKHENARLVESVKAAEIAARTAKDESFKLRDILKQALNEANAAKEAASIARVENSDLKDVLAEKDEALLFLTHENERIRISEVAAHENIKELKRLLSAAKTEDKEQGDIFNSPDSSLYEEHIDEREPKKGFSFDLNELKIFNNPEQMDEVLADEDPEKAEALKGSIFDTTVSPKSEPQTPKTTGAHHRRDSSIFTDAASGTPTSEDLENLSIGHSEDSDEKNPNKKRLFRRLGDLIIRKSFNKKEPSITE